MERIERSTSPLPRECSTTELHGRKISSLAVMPGCTRPCSPPLNSSSGSNARFHRFHRSPVRQPPMHGAGEGNRTLVVSLEGFCSTIELHPRASDRLSWWRGLDSNQRRLSQRIYSPSPLATRAPLRNSPPTEP